MQPTDIDWRKTNNPPHCVFCDSNEHYTVDHPRDQPADDAQFLEARHRLEALSALTHQGAETR